MDILKLWDLQNNKEIRGLIPLGGKRAKSLSYEYTHEIQQNQKG